MGINHLQLSPELIAFLYPETLVNGNDPDPFKKPAKSPETLVNGNDPDPFKKPAKTPETLQTKKSVPTFLGKNLQLICFLVSYPDDEFIPKEQLVFLQKILVACKCSLDDIALVNLKQQPVAMEDLKTQFSPRIIFLWGSLPVIPGIHQKFPDMAISTWEDISIVPVLQADLMSRDNPEGLELKRSLWISLKKLFNL
jgi:hypothetical protein